MARRFKEGGKEMETKGVPAFSALIQKTVLKKS